MKRLLYIAAILALTSSVAVSQVVDVGRIGPGGGGSAAFTGGDVADATEFASAVTFLDSILLPGTVDENDILTIAAGDNTADRTLTLLAGTNLTLTLDSGLFSFANGIRSIEGSNTAVAFGSLAAAGETGWYFSGDSIVASINTGKVLGIGAGNGVDIKVGSSGVYNWASSGDATAGADTGLARSAAGVVKVTDGSTGDGRLLVHAGTVGSPGYSFDDDQDSGIISEGGDKIGFVAGGAARMLVVSNGNINMATATHLGWTSGAILSTGADTGLLRAAAGVVRVTDGSTGAGQLAISSSTTGQRIASKQVTLTEAGGAETVCTITTAAGEMTGGVIEYTIRGTDGTDLVSRTGSFRFTSINAATVVTAVIPQPDATGGAVSTQADDGSILLSTNSKTLTYAIAADVGTANALKLTFDIDSDITINAASITWTVILNGPGTVS